MDVTTAVVGSLFILSGILPWFLLVAVLENRNNPGATGLLVIVPSVSVYVFASGVNTITTTPWVWYVASNLVLLSIAGAAVGWFLTTAEYTGYIERPLRALRVLGGVVLIDQLLAWTNPLHHQYYDALSTLSLPSGIAPHGGILFLLHTTGAYLLVFLGVLACLTAAFNSRGIRRKQNLALLGSVVPPTIASLVWLPRWTPFNYTPLAFVLSVSFLAWVLFEADFLDIVPRGRRRAARRMDDPLVIVDRQGRVVESNSAARELVQAGRDWKGSPAAAFFDPFSEQFQQYLTMETVETDITINRDGERNHFELSISPLAESGDKNDGRLVMLHDITQLKERERRLERLQAYTEQILGGEDRARICETAVDAVEEVIGVCQARAYLYNRREEALVGAAASEDFHRLFEEDPVCQRPGSVLWEVYRAGDVERISATTELAKLFDSDEIPVESVLLVPLDTHGIMLLPAVEPDVFDESDRYFANLLATTVGTALDRARRERGLMTVQDVARDGIAAETHEEMVETVLDQVPEALDFPLSAIWKHDPTSRQLRPVASTGPADTIFDEVPVFEPGNSIAWRAFEEHQTKLIDRTADHKDAYNPESPIESEMISPIGGFGVFAAGSTQENSFTENEKQVFETLTANLRTASRLIERRRDLQLLDQVLGRLLRHNLRNKLNVIQANAKQICDSVDEDTDNHITGILNSCRKLNEHAENAQVMRSIIKNRDERGEISLQEAVDHAVEVVRRDFQNAELRTKFESDATVVAHPDIATAIQQLVRNSVEHNGGDEPPTVSVSVFDTAEGPTVEVTDDGPGIPEYELAVLKQHGESALDHGSGVGLWIVDRVTEYSNATLEFHVEDGTVARITFSG